MSGNQGSNHFGVVTEYPANVLAFKFKFYCEGCQWQSYQETRESAIAIGKQHQAQFGYVQPSANAVDTESAAVAGDVKVVSVPKDSGVTQQVAVPTK